MTTKKKKKFIFLNVLSNLFCFPCESIQKKLYYQIIYNIFSRLFFHTSINCEKIFVFNNKIDINFETPFFVKIYINVNLTIY